MHPTFSENKGSLVMQKKVNEFYFLSCLFLLRQHLLDVLEICSAVAFVLLVVLDLLLTWEVLAGLTPSHVHSFVLDYLSGFDYNLV